MVLWVVIGRMGVSRMGESSVSVRLYSGGVVGLREKVNRFGLWCSGVEMRARGHQKDGLVLCEDLSLFWERGGGSMVSW